MSFFDYTEKMFVAPNLRVAGLGKRIAATLVDYALFMFVYFAAAFLPAFALPSAKLSAQDTGLLTTSIWILIILSYIGFYLYLLDAKGKSPGKILFKLRVVTPSGGKPSSDRMFFFRYLLPRVFGVFSLGIFYLMDAFYLFSGNHRSLHDRLAGTIVIDQKAAGTPDNSQ